VGRTATWVAALHLLSTALFYSGLLNALVRLRFVQTGRVGWYYGLGSALISVPSAVATILGVWVAFRLWRVVGDPALGGWFALALLGVIVSPVSALAPVLVNRNPVSMREPLFWAAMLLPLALSLALVACIWIGLNRAALAPAWVPWLSVVGWLLGLATLWWLLPSEHAFYVGGTTVQHAEAASIAGATLRPLNLAGAVLTVAFWAGLGFSLLARADAPSGREPVEQALRADGASAV